MNEVAPRTKRGPVRICFDDDQDVLVEPPDQDRFVVSSEEAVRACVTQELVDQLRRDAINKFQAVLMKVAAWSAERPQVVQVLLGPRDHGQSLILFVTAGDQHDFDFSDEVNDLDETIYEALAGLPTLSVMTVPQGVESGPEAFMDIDQAFEVYARPDQPSPRVEAVS